MTNLRAIADKLASRRPAVRTAKFFDDSSDLDLLSRLHDCGSQYPTVTSLCLLLIGASLVLFGIVLGVVGMYLVAR
ncbi:MAG: hypothetical protein JSS02_22390 [Planctomycetes bacterium]|nr:hypothetical protein [Planctomycetota bacterium]